MDKMLENASTNDRIGPWGLSSLEYSYLPPGCIRVLSPDPADISHGHAWLMKLVRLDDSDVDNEALSYVWGSSKEIYSIRCNGLLLQAYHNLFTALPYLARRGERRPVRPIWINAICINQQDEVEKSVQIGAMGKI